MKDTSRGGFVAPLGAVASVGSDARWLVDVGGRRWRGGRRSRGGRGEPGLGEDLAPLLGELVLAEDLVAGGDDLGHGGEVTLATGEGVAGRSPHHAEESAPECGEEQQAEGARRSAEEREDEADA